MADLTAFSYCPGTSIFHRLDVRFKLLFMVLLSLAVLKATLPALAIGTVLIFIFYLHVKQRFSRIFKDLRYFFLFIILVFAARAVSTPGEPVMEYLGIVVSQEGVSEGILVCWRLLLIVLLSLLLITTTKPSQVRAAVENLLRPFPRIPAKRIATMLSLLVRFVPTILEQAKDVAAAQRARGVENRKNPVYRMVKYVIPLSYKIFLNADNLATAMEARCYSDQRTDAVLKSGLRDWVALGAVVCGCVLIIVV